MKRRRYLKTLLGAAVTGTLGIAAETAKPIQLHMDLAVDPAKEQEMLNHFETIFKPAAVKQPGYIEVEMLKLNSVPIGKAPAGMNYRFSLKYQSEALRQKWVNSDTHKKVWPTIEKTLSSRDYTVILFDVA